MLGCHPDDAEFMAGGLIARHTQAGGRAVIVHIGGRDKPPPVDHKGYGAARVLGAEMAVYNTDWFGVSEESVDALHDALEQFRPARFVCLWPLDMHPGHASAGFLAYRAVLDVMGGGDTRLRRENELWFGELNPGVNCRSLKPDVYVDVTSVAEQKWTAVGLYVGHGESEDDAIRGWGWFGDNQRTVERSRGYECGCERAEAFATYGGWEESPLDRPWGVPMFPGRAPATPEWWQGKQTYRKAKAHALYYDPQESRQADAAGDRGAHEGGG